MKNIEFIITKEDIKNYLNGHNSDKEIQDNEAMFIKYMKEKNILTKESIEILMEKYNNDTIPFSDCGLYSCLSNNLKILPNFSSYLKVQKLDVSGIYHILVPALGYYKITDKVFLSFNEVKQLPSMFNVPQVSNFKDTLMETLDDYQLIGKVNIFEYDHELLVDVLMDRDGCQNELYQYELIYGMDSVSKIKSLVQKSMKGRM